MRWYFFFYIQAEHQTGPEFFFFWIKLLVSFHLLLVFPCLGMALCFFFCLSVHPSIKKKVCQLCAFLHECKRPPSQQKKSKAESHFKETPWRASLVVPADWPQLRRLDDDCSNRRIRGQLCPPTACRCSVLSLSCCD